MSEVRYCMSRFDALKHLNPDDDAPVSFAYLNQGGANVIFKIIPWSAARTEQPFLFVDRKAGNFIAVHRRDVANKVLRVDKGLDKTLRCDEVVSGFYDHVRPLFVTGSITVVVVGSDGLPTAQTVALPDLNFTKHLMEHQGVLLYPKVMADLMSKADTILLEQKSEMSPHTTSNRWGILLPDMSPTAGLSVTIEVKPKWLAQSPNAPPDAVRCRTCAMHVAKPKDLNSYICPLRLLGGSSNVLYRWVLDRVTEQLVKHLEMATEQEDQAMQIASSIVKYLTQGAGKDLLCHLKFLQTQLDPIGVHIRDKVYPKSIFEHNLRLAMTLRDCSLYITAHYTTTSAIKVDSKLGDLDFKSADKINDWLRKEEALLKEAAYTRRIGEDLGCLVTEERAA